ncbi:MAG: MBL fold metallo-hydrolase [Oscillospiraceae bacterium]
MNFKYLGTAAAEGWPSVFCNCECCRKARTLGGKNIRTRSQALVNSNLLIDLPCDTYLHMLRENLDLSAVEHLLITHSHTDHFYPAELALRGETYAHNMQSPILNIYCNAAVRDYFYRAISHELDENIGSSLHFHIVQPFKPFQAGEYLVTPLPAKHMQTEQALIYLIENGGKSILYAHDTGVFYPAVYDYLAKSAVHLSLVSLDCTSGGIENDSASGHMGLPNAAEVKAKLIQIGSASCETRFIINHFSHNGGVLHQELCAHAGKIGMEPSYDGMTIEI